MPNMSLKKVAMPLQDGEVRRNNFDEVALGYTKEMAMEEAERCLNCKHSPCISGCPVAVNIPAFINEAKQGNFEADIKSFGKPVRCRRCAAVSARRRVSVKNTVCAVLKGKLWALAGWNVLWLTGPERI